ncbi:MAG: peptide chain release factor 1 [Myxococcales bacterium]|nr:peptide chain release factor 1 [Myxococcales bacterium]
MLPTDKLDALSARLSEIDEQLCRPDVAGDASRYTRLMRERAELDELVAAYRRYRVVGDEIEGHRAALVDPELRELAEEELPALETEREHLTERLNLLLLPKDPKDERDVLLEIRSGAGGEEAALFAADLFRMYGRYAETRGWKVELLSVSEAAAGGFKEVIAAISGDHVYSVLRFEGGVHRVQRVPATESQGRIHTSTATVAVMAEVDDIDDVRIDDKDLEITKTAAGGPGGQGVNTTMSAVRIKHLPTGIIVRSEEQRSQHQNKARAMQILRAKLLEAEQEAAASAEAAERRNMVGTGDRAEKIRTYNFPQSRVTDHRIQLTLHGVERILGGDCDELFTALRSYHQAELLRRQRER